MLTGLALLLAPLAAELPRADSPTASPASAYGELPLGFSPNTGSQSSAVEFSTSTAAGSVALTRDGAVITPNAPGADPVRMTLAGAALSKPAGTERLPGVVNDFRGNDPSQWQTNLPTFAKVTYPSVYPGIDVDYYGRDGTLEYDFRVAAGADPSRIGVDFGGEPVRVAPSGALVVGRGEAVIRQAAPVAYQSGPDGREPVASRFEIDRGVVGFELGGYDTSRPLVIDPLVLAYSTYLGGADADYINDIALDGSNNAYLVGDTISNDFPTQGAYQGTKGGPTSGDYDRADAFVTKLNPSGSALIYSTYLGGERNDLARGVAVDASGNAYLAGETRSDNFPVTQGAYQTTPGRTGGYADAFIAKLNPSGSALSYSTRLGGTSDDEANAIAIDSSGNAYVTGITNSRSDATADPPQSRFPIAGIFPGGGESGNGYSDDAFVTKLNANGTNIVYSDYIASTGLNDSSQGQGIAVDSSGRAYVTGNISGPNMPTTASKYEGATPGPGGGNSSDGFLLRISATGAALDYSTYFGGTSDDYPNDVAIDSSGRAFVAGSTQSGDGFDFKNEFQRHQGLVYPDAFLTVLDPSQSGSNSLAYSTLLDGTQAASAAAVEVDSAGHAYVGGYTSGPSSFPAKDPISNSSQGSAFLTKFDVSQSGANSVIYSTTLPQGGFLGAGVSGLALSGTDAYIAGTTQNTTYPSTPGAFQQQSDSTAGYYTPDGFVSKITETDGSDTTPPETTITGGPTNGSTTSDSTPTFNFESSETGSSFGCSVNGSAPSPCSAPFTTSQLSEGTNTFSVVATDAAGNTDQSPASVTFTVDTGPPPDTTPPETTTKGADARTIRSRKLPVSVKFEFSSSEPGSSFRCKLDSGAYKPCTSPKRFTIGRGVHRVYVKATDAAGNEDATAAVVRVTVKKKR
ncbi:hypothetical protein HJD18_01865 [Thermoleophilia bacterium SCSIO 60948]|nr:hypothetical protein HJD18_01865 [Thermoleophilia bacterium SCSIO 60948]